MDSKERKKMLTQLLGQTDTLKQLKSNTDRPSAWGTLRGVGRLILLEGIGETIMEGDGF